MLNKDHKSADFVYLSAEKIGYRLFAAFFYRTSLTPTQITLINFFVNNLGAVVFFSFGKYWANLVGVLFLIASATWDWMDGGVARKKGWSTKGAIFLDPMADFVWQNLLVAGIVFGVFISHGRNLIWLIVGLLALVFLTVINYLGGIYGDSFGFGFRGDYEELIKKVDSSKRAGFFDKLCLEMLTYRKFPFIFLFTIRYSLLLGALFNRLDLFLVLLLTTSLFKSLSLVYLYYLFLEVYRRKKNRVIVEALVRRHQFWLKEKNK